MIYCKPLALLAVPVLMTALFGHANDIVTPEDIDLDTLKDSIIDWASPQHAQCPPDQVLEELDADLAKVYEIHTPHFAQYMSLHEEFKSEMPIDYWTREHLRDALLLKMVHEYATAAYDEMTATFLCLLEYCTLYVEKTTQIGMARCSILQRDLYDLVFLLDLLHFIEPESRSTLYGLLVKLMEEQQLTAVLSNDCIPYMDGYFERVFTGNFLFRSTGRLYSAPFFKHRETNHIMEYAQYLRRFLEDGKCLNDYEVYTLTGGSWIPGRFYAQYMIEVYEHHLKYKYTLNNTVRILLWVLLVYAHKDSTGAYPGSLAEIAPDTLPGTQSLEKLEQTSLMTGMPLVYELGRDAFTINGGPEYRSISGQGGKPVGETVYIGCFTDKD